jgi:hypothetical protein
MPTFANLCQFSEQNRIRLATIGPQTGRYERVGCSRNWSAEVLMMPQELVAARSWRFKSSLPHQPFAHRQFAKAELWLASHAKVGPPALRVDGPVWLTSRQPHFAALPVHLNRILANHRVACDQGKPLSPGLCDEDAVKRILVKHRQCRERRDVAAANVEDGRGRRSRRLRRAFWRARKGAQVRRVPTTACSCREDGRT